MQTPPKLIYFVTEDWYFCSHRLNLAIAARQQGFRVLVVTRVNRHGDLIREQGFELIPLDINRGGLNPWHELKTIFNVWRIYAREKPDIVHHVALKPVLCGGLAAFFVPGIQSINLIAGLGAVFSSERIKTKLLKPVVRLSLHLLLGASKGRVIVQNTEDRDLLIEKLRIDPAKVRLIKGSGVDTRKFHYVPETPGKVTIALVSRLLWDKGIGEYVAAVKLLKQKGLEFSALLVGEPDHENPASVTQARLEAWHDSGLVEWLGHRDDIAEFWQTAHIAVLPSYREGLPKSLLEAAACGRPIVTTDTSGCKEIVKNGVNGLLVPVADAAGLADALARLIVDEELRQRMGREGRKRVEQEFSDATIIAETLKVYRELL